MAWLSFLGIVAAPALAAGFYYGAIASDQYTAQSRLVVRTIGLETEENAGAARVRMLSGGAVIQDAHILVDYLGSRDIVQTLHQKMDLRAALSPPSGDSLSHPPPSLEKLHRQWQRHTTSYVDGPSGIITFSARAFTPQDAVELSKSAITLGAELIETLSDRAKADLLARARAERDRALATYVLRLDALRQLQNSAGILDPTIEASVSTQLISDLLVQRLDREARRNALRASGVQKSPLITRLDTQIDTLTDQIDTQRKQMTSRDRTTGSLSEFVAELSALETDRLLAEALYKSASRRFEAAQSNVARQSTFVAVFAPPLIPTTPTHPRRLAFWGMILCGCLITWATVLLVWAAVEDHRR